MTDNEAVDAVIGIVEDTLREVDGDKQLDTLAAIIEALQEMHKALSAV